MLYCRGGCLAEKERYIYMMLSKRRKKNPLFFNCTLLKPRVPHCVSSSGPKLVTLDQVSMYCSISASKPHAYTRQSQLICFTVKNITVITYLRGTHTLILQRIESVAAISCRPSPGIVQLLSLLALFKQNWISILLLMIQNFEWPI